MRFLETCDGRFDNEISKIKWLGDAAALFPVASIVTLQLGEKPESCRGSCRLRTRKPVANRSLRSR